MRALIVTDRQQRQPRLGRRGYIDCDLTSDRLQAAFRVSDTVSVPDAPVYTLATYVTDNGRPGARRDA